MRLLKCAEHTWVCLAPSHLGKVSEHGAPRRPLVHVRVPSPWGERRELLARPAELLVLRLVHLQTGRKREAQGKSKRRDVRYDVEPQQCHAKPMSTPRTFPGAAKDWSRGDTSVRGPRAGSDRSRSTSSPPSSILASGSPATSRDSRRARSICWRSVPRMPAQRRTRPRYGRCTQVLPQRSWRARVRARGAALLTLTVRGRKWNPKSPAAPNPGRIFRREEQSSRRRACVTACAFSPEALTPAPARAKVLG